MKAKYFVLSSLLMVISCTGNFKITDNEDKGVKEVLSLFGGYCKYSIGWDVSTKTGKKKYFELELSKSAFVDNMADMTELPASGVAYYFYKNLKGERRKYTHIKV